MKNYRFTLNNTAQSLCYKPVFNIFILLNTGRTSQRDSLYYNLCFTKFIYLMHCSGFGKSLDHVQILYYLRDIDKSLGGITNKIMQRISSIDKIITKIDMASKNYIDTVAGNVKQAHRINKDYWQHRSAFFYFACWYLIIGPLLMIGEIVVRIV